MKYQIIGKNIQVTDAISSAIKKKLSRMDRSGRTSFAEAVQFQELEEEQGDKEEDVVVRAKSYYLQSMKIDEAILRMEALGHDFFLYLDEEDDRISVVYIRRDGGYGVIQAENPIA